MNRRFGKKLVLNREMIRELTHAQLEQVAGAGDTHQGSPCPLTQQTYGCGCTSASIFGDTCLCSGQFPQTCAMGCC